MVVGFANTCAISVYHHYSCEFEPHSWRGVLDTTLCDKVCDLQQVRRFSPGTPASATNKTYHHDITEILLKVALNTINKINLNGKKSLICNTVVITYQLEMLCYNSENSFCGPCRTTE
jgi:hypothetical protein